MKCRQKTKDLAAECKNIKKNKPCPIRYCHKCLLNRSVIRLILPILLYAAALVLLNLFLVVSFSGMERKRLKSQICQTGTVQSAEASVTAASACKYLYLCFLRVRLYISLIFFKICRKKRGCQPTGMLVHTAKAKGFSSVSEMLQVGGTNLNIEKSPNKDVGGSSGKRAASETVCTKYFNAYICWQFILFCF